MHADLDTNDATDGEFESATCTKYYAMVEDNDDFDEAIEEAFGEGADGGY